MQAIEMLVSAFLGANIYPDVILGLAFFLAWVACPFLYAFDLSLKSVIAIMIAAPMIVYFIWPSITNLFLNLAPIYALFAVCIIESMRLLLKTRFPDNNHIDIRRFDLSPVRLKEFHEYYSERQAAIKEIDALDSLDLPRRKDGKFSENSRRGKTANQRLEQLKKSQIDFILRGASLLESVGDFSDNRKIHRALNKIFTTALIVAVIITFMTGWLVPTISLIPLNMICLSLVVLFIFVMAIFSIDGLEKEAKELEDQVIKRYLDGQP